MCVQTVDWHVFFSVFHFSVFYQITVNELYELHSNFCPTMWRWKPHWLLTWSVQRFPLLFLGCCPVTCLTVRTRTTVSTAGDWRSMLWWAPTSATLSLHCWAPCIMGRWVCTYKHSPVDMYAYSILMMNACGWVLGAVGRIKHCKWVMMWWTGHINFLVTVFSSSNFLDAFSKDCTEVQNIASSKVSIIMCVFQKSGSYTSHGWRIFVNILWNRKSLFVYIAFLYKVKLVLSKLEAVL